MREVNLNEVKKLKCRDCLCRKHPKSISNEICGQQKNFRSGASFENIETAKDAPLVKELFNFPFVKRFL